MDTAFSERFISLWNQYFPGAGLPIAFFYTDQAREADLKETVNLDRCLIGNLKRVQDGYSFVYDAHTPGCSGGKRYSGFSKTLRPKFEYFLSCGIPGELEGERYKKSPQLVEEYLKSHPPFEAPGKYLVFKRLDKLTEDEKPLRGHFLRRCGCALGSLHAGELRPGRSLRRHLPDGLRLRVDHQLSL